VTVSVPRKDGHGFVLEVPIPICTCDGRKEVLVWLEDEGHLYDFLHRDLVLCLD